MGFVIDRASSEDWPSILRVLESANMHHIPSKEMPGLDLSCCFVARQDGLIVGVGGYKMLPDGRGKTTLLVVLPEFRNHGIGLALQMKRIEAIEGEGASKIITNVDDPSAISWYKHHFGYREVGTLKKLHEFGLVDVDHWTTLEMDIRKWRDSHGG